MWCLLNTYEYASLIIAILSSAVGIGSFIVGIISLYKVNSVQKEVSHRAEQQIARENYAKYMGIVTTAKRNLLDPSTYNSPIRQTIFSNLYSVLCQMLALEKVYSPDDVRKLKSIKDEICNRFSYIQEEQNTKNREQKQKELIATGLEYEAQIEIILKKGGI